MTGSGRKSPSSQKPEVRSQKRVAFSKYRKRHRCQCFSESCLLVNIMNYLPKLSELTDIQIAEAARAAGEPEWLVERREAAWRFFAESVPPIWKRTDLTRFQPDQIAAPLSAQGTALQWDASLAAQGVIFTT